MYNALLNASGNYPADKIKDRILFSLSHLCLYLAELDDELYNKSADANTSGISCVSGGSRS